MSVVEDRDRIKKKLSFWHLVGPCNRNHWKES